MKSNRLFIVFDTETTGLTKQSLNKINLPVSINMRGSEVCQIGGIILNEGMVPLKLFCHYCDVVSASSQPAAYNTHKINQREIRYYLVGQFLPEVMTKYLPEFFAEDVIFIGYNSEFDMTMVAQSLANSPLSWKWKRVTASIVPRHGRYSVDVAEYFKQGSSYRRLSSFERELDTMRLQFISYYEKRLSVQTNCIELLDKEWGHAHNSLFDSINTFLLWSDKIWKKKLV